MTARKTPAKAEATTTEAPAKDTERDTAMRACYQRALAELKDRHEDEWNELLDSEYASAGLDVRRRLTDEQRAQREAEKVEAKRQKLLAALNALPETTAAVSADPFSE